MKAKPKTKAVGPGALVALVLVTAGCRSAEQPQLPAAAAKPYEAISRVQITATTRTPYSSLPSELSCQLVLFPDGTGTLALPCIFADPGPQHVVHLKWQRTGHSFDLTREGGDDTKGCIYSVEWSTFRLDLKDSNGDGILDTGEGTADILVSVPQGHIMHLEWYRSVKAVPDAIRS